MALVRLNRSLLRKISYRSIATTNIEDDEYTATPQYPPILDLSFKKRKDREKHAVHKEVETVPTIEEKQIKLNMPKYYGFKCHMFHENEIPYDQLNLVQYITKTHLIVNNDLPDYYKGVNVDKLCEDIKSQVEDALLIEHSGYRRKHEVMRYEKCEENITNIIAQGVTKHINRILMNKLTDLCKYITDVQVIFEPRIEASWYVGGIVPPLSVQSTRRGVDWMKDMVNDPVDRTMQYIGTPVLNLNGKKPLLPIIPHSEAENPDFKVPLYKYDPLSVCAFTMHRRLTNIPGYWPGNSYQFGLISYHNRGHLNPERNYNDRNYIQEALHRQGILASFGWLHAQANYLGFTTFNEITYPLVCQSVITDSRLWSFYTYQLNALLMHSNNIADNPKQNICWATPEMKLFEEITDGRIIGFNEDVLKMLLKYYINEPQDRLGINYSPYLNDKVRVSAEYADNDKREWLEREYKFLMSNRPRFLPDYEIYHWEKIYKIDHNTRFMDKKLRSFELKINPFKRRLDERQPKYIPRALRPDLPKHKGRYAKEYFP